MDNEGERPEDPNFKWDRSDLDHHVYLNIFEKNIHKDHVALPPFWLCNPLKGVAEDIDKELGQWKKSLNGYLVAYENIEYDGAKVGGMFGDQPWIHIDVRATFYTYKPFVGQILRGTIKRVGATAALCTIYNCFSVTVYPSLPDELSNWQVGSQIEFKVTTVQNRRKGPVIRATSCGTEKPFAAREFQSSNTPKKPMNTTLKFTDSEEAEIEVDSFTGLPMVCSPQKNSGIDEGDFREKLCIRILVEETEADDVNISQFPPEPGALTTYVAEDVNLDSPKKKKSKKQKPEGDESADPPVALTQESEEMDEPAKKKKKKQKKDKSVVADVETLQEEDVSVQKKKKKRKEDVYIKQEFDSELDVEKPAKKKKKKQKKDKSVVADVETLQEEDVSVQKKKKKRKEDVYIKQEFDSELDVEMTQEAEEPIKKKKKHKKDKDEHVIVKQEFDSEPEDVEMTQEAEEPTKKKKKHKKDKYL